jgi:hypothetical protein
MDSWPGHTALAGKMRRHQSVDRRFSDELFTPGCAGNDDGDGNSSNDDIEGQPKHRNSDKRSRHADDHPNESKAIRTRSAIEFGAFADISVAAAALCSPPYRPASWVDFTLQPLGQWARGSRIGYQEQRHFSVGVCCGSLRGLRLAHQAGERLSVAVSAGHRRNHRSMRTMWDRIYTAHLRQNGGRRASGRISHLLFGGPRRTFLWRANH